MLSKFTRSNIFTRSLRKKMTPSFIFQLFLNRYLNFYLNITSLLSFLRYYILLISFLTPRLWLLLAGLLQILRARYGFYLLYPNYFLIVLFHVHYFQHCHIKEDSLFLATSTFNSEKSSSDKIKIIMLASYSHITKGLYLQIPVHVFLFTVAFSLSSFFLCFHISR